MKKAIIYLLATLGLAACAHLKRENADVAEFAKLLDEPDIVVLDVRTPAEYSEGHLAGAMNIDQGLSDFTENAKAKLPADKTIALYCKGGRRSADAADRLTKEGYRCVNMKGGITAWKEAGMAVTTDTYEVDVFKTKSGKTVKLHAMGHASIRIEYAGKEIEIDPVAKQTGRTIDYTTIPKADYIFVTHEHGDHFDRAVLNELSDMKTRLVANKHCAEKYGSGEVMANGDRKQMADDITVEAVPAYNTTEDRLQFHPQGRDNGYILTLDGLRIYIAGDTEDIPELTGIKDIDIAFLPCNQPYTMTTEQLVRAAGTLKPKVLFPYHYGQTDVGSVPALLKDKDIDVRIRHYE